MSLVDFPGERRQVREPPGVRATPFVWRDPATIPTRQWLFGRHAIRRYISATVATGGVGKTSLLLGEALAYASGRDLFADALMGKGGVWYIGLEDPHEEYERRIAAAILHHRITPAEIDGRLFLDTGRDQDFNLALPPEGGLWRQLVSVPLGNGNGGPDDIVGVAARWTWPSAFEGVTAADLYAVQRRIADGQWRKDVQAKDWAGNAVAEVLDLDGSDKAVRARINRLLSVWIENGALIVTEGKDQKGNPRKFVSVGGWAT